MSSGTISQFVQSLLPAKRRTSPKGWISFNAVCCHHRGERPDTRGRGGIMFGADGKVTYHCFNCGFKTRYWPGDHLSINMRKLLRWLGASDTDISRLKIEALRVKAEYSPEDIVDAGDHEIKFEKYALPPETISFSEMATYLRLLDDDEPIPQELTHFQDAVNYAYNRKIDFTKFDLAWSSSKEHLMNFRVIVPCIYQNEIYGYTARAFRDTVKPKYYAQHDGNFVFNLDRQTKDRKFVIVVEGAFDAMVVDGVAVLHNEINETQCELIERLGREVIVVPDFDNPGSSLITAAIDLGWNVSFPVWRDQAKDVSEAVGKWGKLFVMKSILEGKIDNPLKIKLMLKGLR